MESPRLITAGSVADSLVLDASFFQMMLVVGTSLFLLVACVLGYDVLRAPTTREQLAADRMRDKADGSRILILTPAGGDDEDGERAPLLLQCGMSTVDGDGATYCNGNLHTLSSRQSVAVGDTLLRLCAAPGCTRSAKYGFDSHLASGATWCKAHREERDGQKAPRVVPRKCRVAGCSEEAIYGEEYLKPLFCRQHRRKGTEVASRIGHGPRRYFSYADRLPHSLRKDNPVDPLKFT